MAQVDYDTAETRLFIHYEQEHRSQTCGYQAGGQIHGYLNEHDPEARVLTRAACESIDQGKKRGITRHAQIDRGYRAAHGHSVDVVLEPVRGDLFIKNRVAGISGELQHEKQPQGKSCG